MQISRLRIGQKLVLALGLAILVSFLIAGVVVGRIGDHYANDTASDSAETINAQVVNMVEVFAGELEHSADLLLGTLALGYPDRFRLDESATTRVGERNVAALYNGQRPVSLDYAFIDRVAIQTKSVATVFVRDGNDFIRIATSLKKEDGARAVGTVLDQKHPAYAKLIGGESYRGEAKLFGRNYFTKYQPIKEGNKVIGVLFVGVDFTKALAKLRDQIKSVRLGETGYVFVVNANAADKEYGHFVVHPTLEGKSALEVQDARGKYLVKEMLEKKKGEIRYLWQRQNTSRASESLAVVAIFPEFDWMVATRADISELSRSVNAVQWAMFVVGLVLLVALPLVVVVVTRRVVTRPLGELQNFCAEIERSKDFTLQPPRHGEDEVGQTTDSVTRLLKVLRQTFIDLLEDIRKVDEASRSMSNTARETARNSGQASDSASAMAASVEELSVGINHIASSANEAAALSRDAGVRSQEGGKTILDATAEMNAIADKVRHTSSAITSLGEESRQISGIVAVIKEVAEQTNLLALNAAIEAARAGDAGRGFAVVADEVRKLAERTTLATAEIAKVTGSIHQRAEQAVDAMAEAVEQVELGAALSTQAGTAISDIRSSSERVVEVVRQITDALSESSAASQNMANQTERVARVAEESDHGAQVSAQAADKLEKLTGEMRNMVGRFKI